MAISRDLPSSARCVIIGGGVGGHVDRLPPRRARLARRRAARPRAAHERLDVPLGRARRPAALVGVADADDDVLGRALPEARRRRVRPGLDGVRRHPARLLARALGGDAPPGRLGEDVRPAARADLGRGGGGEVPADGHRRRARRLVAADRRLPRPVPAHLRAGRRRAPRRLPHLHRHARDGDRRAPRPRAPRADRAGRHRGRRRGQRRRHVRGGDRPAGGRAHPGHPVRARVPRHAAVPGARRPAPADACATPTC